MRKESLFCTNGSARRTSKLSRIELQIDGLLTSRLCIDPCIVNNVNKDYAPIGLMAVVNGWLSG